MQIFMFHNDFLYTITLDFYKILQSWKLYPYNYGNLLSTILGINFQQLWEFTQKTFFTLYFL